MQRDSGAAPPFVRLRYASVFAKATPRQDGVTRRGSPAETLVRSLSHGFTPVALERKAPRSRRGTKHVRMAATVMGRAI